MMPGFTFQSPANRRRASVIAAEIVKLDYDILCFEKAFDGGARSALYEALKSRYPNQYGPANSGFAFLKINSGVWVLSRFPLSDRHEIQYRDCAGIECRSRKGAMLLSGTFEGRPFQILATHLQGEAGAHYTPEHQQIRNRQMAQLRDELLARYAQPGVPLLLCGDFDTPRLETKNQAHESDGYRAMLQILGNPQNDHKPFVTFDDNCSDNDLAIESQGRRDETDYILVRTNGVPLEAEWNLVKLRHYGWDGHTARQDLSYRYAVGATIQFR